MILSLYFVPQQLTETNFVLIPKETWHWIVTGYQKVRRFWECLTRLPIGIIIRPVLDKKKKKERKNKRRMETNP